MLGLPVALARIVSVAWVPALAQFPGLCEDLKSDSLLFWTSLPAPSSLLYPHTTSQRKQGI